jgi:hypothetical protein
MTIIGFSVTPDTALVWGDTNYFWSLNEDREEKRHLAGKLLGQHLKIAINERSCMVAVGAGDVGGNDRIRKATEFADSFDHLCSGLPVFLMGGALDRFDACDEWPPWICAAVGWSRRFNRMMGAVFHNSAEFSARYATEYSAPYVSEIGSLNPHDPADILGLVQAQSRHIQRSYPLAGAGTVTIAQLRRSGVNVTSYDLVTGRESKGLPNIPAMGTHGGHFDHLA